MATSGKNRQGGNAAQPALRPKVSAKVYRRRRQVVGVLALIIIAGLVAGGIALANFLGRSNASDAGIPPAATASATTSAGSDSAPTAAQAAPPVAAPSGVCDESGIKVSGAVDKQSYPAGVDPKLSLRVTNTGKAPCDINVGTSQMEFKVTSGADIIFNSRDCQSGSTNLVKNLKPGASETANFTWKRSRSAPGCTKVTVTPGAGTYKLVATLGKWSGDSVPFQLQ